MTLFYSYNQEWPRPLPFRIITSNGSSRTDPKTFTPQELIEWGYTGPFEQPVFDADTQVLQWDGSGYVSRDKTDEEVYLEISEQWQKVRDCRLDKLRDSDWTQLPDSPVEKSAWASYRQQLRDVTQQTNPFSIQWPQAPVNPPVPTS